MKKIKIFKKHELEILFNHEENWLPMKVFIHLINICLWFLVFYVVFAISFAETAKEHIWGTLGVVALVLDFFAMSREHPKFINPFDKNNNNNNNNNGNGGNYLSDIEAATKEAELPGSNLGDLF